jgi:hypothetical protein
MRQKPFRLTRRSPIGQLGGRRELLIIWRRAVSSRPSRVEMTRFAPALMRDVSAVRPKIVPNQLLRVTGVRRGALAAFVAGLATLLIVGCGIVTVNTSPLKAFRNCMSSHGVTIPATRPTSTPTSGTSPIDRFLNGLDAENSKVAAAVKACESKLPFLR